MQVRTDTGQATVFDTIQYNATQCNASYANAKVIDYRRTKERMQELKVPRQEALSRVGGCKGKGEKPTSRQSSPSRNFDSVVLEPKPSILVLGQSEKRL